MKLKRKTHHLLTRGKMALYGHVLNPLWLSSEQRRAIRSEAFGKLIPDYLEKYCLGAVESVPETVGSVPETGPSDVGQEKIFSIWFQGEENAPDTVKSCFASIRRHCTQELVVLDEKSLWDYISLPDCIVSKFKQGKIGYAHFSDLCRVELLYRYGGYWIDATAFATGPVPEVIADAPFFVYRTGHRISGYYSYIQNCFIHARKGEWMIAAWRAMMFAYWAEEDKRLDYFQHQLMFKVLVTRNERARRLFEAMPQIDHDLNHLLWYDLGAEPSCEELIPDLIPAENFFQKTCSRDRRFVPGSWREWIAGYWRRG